MEIARSAARNSDEGSWLLELSHHFMECQMYPLAAKMMEEALVAFRRDNLALEETRVSVMSILDMLARLYQGRLCHEPPRIINRSITPCIPLASCVPSDWATSIARSLCTKST